MSGSADGGSDSGGDSGGESGPVVLVCVGMAGSGKTAAVTRIIQVRKKGEKKPHVTLFTSELISDFYSSFFGSDREYRDQIMTTSRLMVPFRNIPCQVILDIALKRLLDVILFSPAQECESEGLRHYGVNLDPACLSVPFPVRVDIRDTVSAPSLQSKMGLGPNGAIVTALNLFATKVAKVIPRGV